MLLVLALVLVLILVLVDFQFFESATDLSYLVILETEISVFKRYATGLKTEIKQIKSLPNRTD